MRNKPLKKKRTDDVTFIILGATGDLTKQKLIPAVCRLIENKKIKNFALLGAAKTDTSIEKILKTARPFVKNSKTINYLGRRFYYQALDFYKKGDFQRLKKTLAEVEKKHGLSGNRIFYLATLPQHFDKITYSLDKSGVAKESRNNWRRVVYEKPFGEDLRSARKINRCINRIFKEKQVYRIDHYLGKELVGNIALMRFANRILEPLWCGRHIDSAQIILSENFGVEGRGGFYDKYGVMKDVIQNHALQLLALMAMESPKMLEEKHIRDEKSKVLQKTIIKDWIYGQYKGYRDENKVAKDSKTPTFVALRAEINNKRWKGVPFFIKAGKNLDKKETTIHLRFKKVDCLLDESCPQDTNYFTIRVQPSDGFSLELNTKVPGKKNQVTPVKMDFCQKTWFGPNTPEAYETLLEDVIDGDQSVFVRQDEIELAWKIVEDTLAKKKKAHPYQKKSKGPKEFQDWSRKQGVRWKE